MNHIIEENINIDYLQYIFNKITILFKKYSTLDLLIDNIYDCIMLKNQSSAMCFKSRLNIPALAFTNIKIKNMYSFLLYNKFDDWSISFFGGSIFKYNERCKDFCNPIYNRKDNYIDFYKQIPYNLYISDASKILTTLGFNSCLEELDLKLTLIIGC
jgi:hypothetical protein